MNISVIDLGTNTFNLLIASVLNNTFTPIYSTKRFVQLGKGGINKKILQDDAIERAMFTLKEYKQFSIDYNCDQTIAIATSAIRNANNGNDFVKKVKQELGIEISTIDGNKEAEYIYLGARAAVDLSEGKSIVMDVGGGSTEFIICNHKQIFWKQSFEVGAARLKEAFHFTEPISLAEIKNIENHVETILAPLFIEAKKHGINRIVGCSGAFSSFAAILVNQENKPEELKGKTHYSFDVKKFKQVNQLLISSDLNARLEIPGLIQERAPMIVVGSVLVNYVLNKLDIKSFELSRFSLKEGVVFNYINQ